MSHKVSHASECNHALFAFERILQITSHYEVAMAKSLASMFFTPQKMCYVNSTMHTQWCCPKTKAHNNRNALYFVSSAVCQPSTTINETLVDS